MRNAKIEHDPNTNADWDAPRVYVGASWWVAADPARVEPRRLPNAVARAARRFVEAEREGLPLLIEDAHFGLLRELCEEAK